MIKGAEISTISSSYVNKNGQELLYIGYFNKINIFIGENNSGKSRMLRYLFNSNEVKALTLINKDVNKKNYNEAKKSILQYVSFFNSSNDNYNIDIPSDLEDLDDVNYYIELHYIIGSMKIDLGKLNYNQKSYWQSINSYLNNMYISLTRNDGYNSIKINDYDVTYIPVLRGVECFDNYYELKKNDELKKIALNDIQREAMNEYKDNSKHIYSNKTSKVYRINSTKIFTAENLFEEIRDKLLGEEKDRLFIKEFEDFISKEFYDNKGFTIIPKIKESILYVKIGNGSERALHDLGDGIKQLITILYKVFEKKNKLAIFFIEEPELNLHPGYQRQLMQLLLSNDLFSNHQFFITTHSNHIIDSSLDFDNISLYKFSNISKKNNLFKVVKTSNKDIEILDLLGVYNTSVFISNCTIWVEGISDKILISKYLDVYLKNEKEFSYKEDINYSFVEYDGNNIEHWSFEDNNNIETINASGITNRCFIIVDNDGDSKKKRKEKLKKIFGEKYYYELDVREIENTISRYVLEKTLFNGEEPKYIDNYKGEKYATKSSYMGDFIDSHYNLKKKYSNKSKDTNKGSGTIKEKISFSKKIVQNINDVSDLSQSAMDLCKRLYNFIKESNNI